tara:strand:- start:753 stop:1217 length:465 start_codon:yes stop_codon:yes gene_type:complete
MLLNKKTIPKIKMGGRGGGEKAFSRVLVNCERINESLYDFVDKSTGEKIELKKQQAAQWFDGWKYYNLSNSDRGITMLFVMHDGNRVTNIYSVPLGTMIDTLLSDPEYSKSGWNNDVLSDLYSIKKSAPKVQSKLPLNVKKFVNKHSGIFKIEY